MIKNINKNKRLLLIITVAIVIVIIASFLTLANWSKPETTEETTEPTSTAPIQQEKVLGTEAEEAVIEEVVKEPEEQAVLVPEEEKAVLEETGAEQSE